VSDPRRSWALRATALVAIVAAAWLFLRHGDEPDYPGDWPALQRTKVQIDGRTCPDLTGTYTLPRSAPTRGAKRRDQFVFLWSFLGVNGQDRKSGRSPPKMTLEGPGPEGLRVVFFNQRDDVVMDEVLKPGVGFLCRGRWISDALAEHTRAKPTFFYAKDVDGRLIGHKAYSGGGFTLLLAVFPLPVYVNDHEWWRLEPAPASK
jgi:hypothetical protein